MYIVHIASELAPVAKVGGLADVVHGLSKELAKEHQVEIILPKYDGLDPKHLKDLHIEQKELWITEGAAHYNNTVWSAQVDGLKTFFIEAHGPRTYFNRGKIYGCVDDIERFLYFCKAALEHLLKAGKKPDILHIHDWPTALIAPLYKERYSLLGLKAKAIVFTIHNLRHQEKCPPQLLTSLGLPGENYLTKDKMQDPFFPKLINILKGGIVYADGVTTVSPTYEKEIKTPEGGCGLHEVLLESQSKLKGILNGIDETLWNPEKDPHLIKQYCTHNIDNPKKLEAILQAKEENRKHLCFSLNMSQEKRPLVASVTRLVLQKGPDLILHGLLKTLEKGGQFILLGSVFDPAMEEAFEEVKKTLSQNKNISIRLENDESLAHLIFASADMFLIPSIFEPCGLTQLIALRYGAVPLARLTGGLADTVFDVDTSSKPLDQRNGFTFEFPDSQGVDWALGRALECWKKDQPKWHTIMQQGMRYDFSWKNSAAEYLKVYRSSARLM